VTARETPGVSVLFVRGLGFSRVVSGKSVSGKQ